MIEGIVDSNDVPKIELAIHGRTYSATIDTGFNGDLELPEILYEDLNPVFIGRIQSSLAGGQLIEEDAFAVEFPFDGRMIAADATFVDGDDILIGTRLIRDYRLEIDFPRRLVRLERAD